MKEFVFDRQQLVVMEILDFNLLIATRKPHNSTSLGVLMPNAFGNYNWDAEIDG
jgi:hypothetical protein